MILVMIGAIFLLNNFGYIHFRWENLWHLWPIFLVIAGVNLLFANNRSPWASILKISVLVGGFALILFGNFSNRYHWWPRFHYQYNNDKDNDSNDDSDDDNSDDSGKMVKVLGNSEFKEPFNAAVKVARINISGGATTYRLTDTTSELFKANTRQFHGRYQFATHKEDSVYVMDFIMKNHKGVWGWGNNNGEDSDKAEIRLNTNPEWEVNVDAGATDLDFDLSPYKLRSVKLNGGAGAFKIKVGHPLAVTNVTVSTGASDVTIEIPNDAACHIQSDSGLSSNTFDGFDKKQDGQYETAGFGSAKNRIYIHISGGISDFKVHKY